MSLRNLGRVCSSLLLVLATLSFSQAQTPPAPAAASTPPAKRARSTTKTIAATLLALDPAAKTLRLAPQDGGEALAVVLRSDSKFTKKSKAAQAGDFAVKDKVVARLSFRATGGEVWLRDLWDEASHDAYTRAGREIAVGVIAVNTGERLDIKRADGSVISFRVTDKTQVRKDGAESEIKRFTPGASVAAQPRRLPGGDIMASIVADTTVDVAAARLDGLVNWEGTVESVDASKNTMTLKRSDGALRTVTVTPTARVARGSLKDLLPGTPIRVHLLKATEASGPRTADRITVARPKK